MQKLSATLTAQLEDALKAAVVDTVLLHSGDHHLYRIRLSNGKDVVVKSGATYPDAYEKEAYALSVIASTSTIAAVEVYHVSADTLVMAYIEQQRMTAKLESHAAGQLAAMHRFSSSEFGWVHDNYLAKNLQLNNCGFGKSWGEFFTNARIKPLLAICRQNGCLEPVLDGQLEHLVKKLPELLKSEDSEQKSLLHGDLWAGNLLWGTDEAVLIDPASYFGHRELDLAMLALFGGVGERFFTAYQKHWPLASGWQRRRPLLQLYYLLYHLEHFGRSYESAIREVCSQYSGN